MVVLGLGVCIEICTPFYCYFNAYVIVNGFKWPLKGREQTKVSIIQSKLNFGDSTYDVGCRSPICAHH